MTILRGPGVQSKDLLPIYRELTKNIDVKEKEIDGVAAQLIRQEHLGAEWQRALKSPDQRHEVLKALVEQLEPVSTKDLKESWDEARRLASTVSSFNSLCKALQYANRDEAVEPAYARHQHEARVSMLQAVNAVERGVEAAGAGEAVGRFPLAQLKLIKESLIDQLRAIEAERDASTERLGELPKALSAKDVSTTEKAAQAIARILGDDALAQDLAAAKNRAKDPNAYERNLGAFALLVDQASTTPDYSTVRMGWHHLNSRTAYRARLHDPWNLYASESRLDSTQASLLEAARGIAQAAKPDQAAEKALTAGFVAEVGVDPKVSAQWKPTAEGVRYALEHEAILPLRALNETIEDMAERHVGQEKRFRKVVQDITQHVAEGDFRDWRFSHPASKKQLSVLDAAQQEKWKDHNVSVENEIHGRKLKTREEDDVDLMWVTKIGGPSHGFDFGGHCLLPLITNARTKAILIDEAGWPNAAARAYLRLLSREDGSPVLYLEPLQRDFPHTERFKDADTQAAYYMTLVEHAMRKAEQLGVPLSVPERLGITMARYIDMGEVARRFGLEAEPDRLGRYVLAGSGGVVEASDTMSRKHDWVQTESEIITPHNPRLIILPAERGR